MPVLPMPSTRFGISFFSSVVCVMAAHGRQL
jgi:hypothetical protein